MNGALHGQLLAAVDFLQGQVQGNAPVVGGGHPGQEAPQAELPVVGHDPEVGFIFRLLVPFALRRLALRGLAFRLRDRLGGFRRVQAATLAVFRQGEKGLGGVRRGFLGRFLRLRHYRAKHQPFPGGDAVLFHRFLRLLRLAQGQVLPADLLIGLRVDQEAVRQVYHPSGDGVQGVERPVLVFHLVINQGGPLQLFGGGVVEEAGGLVGAERLVDFQAVAVGLRRLGGGKQFFRTGIQIGDHELPILLLNVLKALDHLVCNEGDGVFVDLEDGAVAVGNVIGAVVPHILRQVDHAETAVHPAVLVLIPDLEPVPALLQHAEGGPAGDFPQGGGGAVRFFIEGLVDDRPDGGVQGVDGGEKLRLLRGADGAVSVLRHHLEAVMRPGAQAAQLIGEALRRVQGLQQGPAFRAPLLELVVLSPGFVPLQGVGQGLRFPGDEVQVVAQQVLPLHAYAVRGGAAEDVALPPDSGSDVDFQGAVIAGQDQVAAGFADLQVHLLFTGGGHWKGNAVLQGKDLVELRDLPRLLPGEGQAPRPRGPHRLRRGEVRVRHLHDQSLAGQPPGHAQKVLSLHNGLDADRHGEGQGVQQDAGGALQLLHMAVSALDVQVITYSVLRSAARTVPFRRRTAVLPVFRQRLRTGLGPVQQNGSILIEADADVSLLKAGAYTAGYVKVSGGQGQSRQRKGGGSGQNELSIHQDDILQGSG